MHRKIISLFIFALSANAFADTNDSGYYGSASLGYIQGNDNSYEMENGVVDDYTTATDPNGLLIALGGGYSTPIGTQFIAGIEADIEWRHARDRSVYLFGGVPDTDYPVTTKLENAATLRGRLGYLFNDRKTQAFIAAGFATARISRAYYDITANPDHQTIDARQNGWMTGLGLEHKLNNKLSIQGEYRYADYKTKALMPSEIYSNTNLKVHHSYDEQSLRVGAVYHY
jgi:outer membrane immunogenic protein